MTLTRKTVRVAVLAALFAGIAFVAAETPDGSDGHRVFVVVPEAVNVIAGQQVRAAGQTVGEVEGLKAVRGGRAARIALRIDDEAWPLTRGAQMHLRWGGTIAANNRYIELRPGPAEGPALPDSGTFPASDFKVPFEFDQLLSTFPPAARRDMRAMLDNSGAAFRTARRPFRRSLATAPPALSQASAVLEDLEAQSSDLHTLVRSGDSVVDAMSRADPGLGRLVSGAAATFRATASQAGALRSMLRETPRTFRSTRTTLARADSTLHAVGELTDRLAPGVDELRSLTGPMTGILRSIVQVGPDARSAFASARRASPSLNPLLVRLTDLMPRLGSIGRQSAEQLMCMRPYAPEIAAFFSVWGDRFNHSDGRDMYSRALVQGAPYNNAQTDDSAQVAAKNPDLTYAFPTPPGFNAGQPWLLPECGLGEEVLDPAKDPESRPFDPASRFPSHTGPSREAGP